MSEFKMQRCEAFFKPAGSKEFVSLGSCDPKDVLLTATYGVGGKTIAQTVRLGDPESMETATNELAALVIGRRDPMKITEHGFKDDGTPGVLSIACRRVD